MSTVREGSPFVSHGRGGAANVTRDDQPYADGGIVREGPAGQPGSTGRGGQGNIEGVATPKGTSSPAGVGSPRVGPQQTTATAKVGGTSSSTDYVPEVNVKQAPDNYHVGRGGEGNAQMHGADSERTSSVGNDGGNDGKPPHVHEGAAQRFKEMLLGKEGKP